MNTENKEKLHNVCLGVVLADFREKASISQVEMAKRLEVTQGTISRLEAGKIPVLYRYVSAYADQTGCSIPAMETQTHAGEVRACRILALLADTNPYDLFAALDEKKQHAIVQTAFLIP